MGWFSRKRKDKHEYLTPTLEELSSVRQESLRTVQAAIGKCTRAQGDEFVHAWRELHVALQRAHGGAARAQSTR